MTTNAGFRFEATISQQGYRQKPVSIDYATMNWVRRTVSLSEFVSLIQSGHSYCHIYHNNRRQKEKFLHTNFVSIDVDQSKIDLLTFLGDCHLKPTFAYETFSNGKNGFYSFRLVFVFREQISKRGYPQMYDKLCRMTGLSNTKDNCGKVLTQLMNGTTGNAYVYRSNYIYSSVTDLPIDDTRIERMVESGPSLFDLEGPEIARFPNPGATPIVSSGNPIFKPISPTKPVRIYKPKWMTEEAKEYLRNISGFSYSEYLNFHKQFYKLVRWSRLDFNESGYAVIPEGHLSLFVRYDRKQGQTTINKFRDGEKRRNRLFLDGLTIRKIKPDITFYELFYNLVHRVHFYYDNSDGVLSYLLIYLKTHDVMNYDMEGVDFKSYNVGSIITSSSYCRNHNISRRAHSRKAL